MHRLHRRSLLAAGAVLALQLSVAAPDLPAQAPDFEAVTGHDFGEAITGHHQMVRYLERAAAASDRVRLLDQGASWEGRRLLAAVVTAPANHRRLDSIRSTAARLADPRGVSADRVDRIVEEHPIVVWYGGSIHGNELSGSEAVLKLFERLVTSTDAATRRVLREAVVIVDPMLNPDGRDAFAARIRERMGSEALPDRRHWSNDFTAWESIKYRTGHYFFDTNRDWFANTQRETRARVSTLRDWNPQVAVDAHEMGPEAEFYFDPAGEPYPPYFPEYAREGFERFNRAYAGAFDSAGFEYMTRERYNYFYPGYTTSYSTYRGAVGMLYEQGTSSGLAVERPDGSVRRLEQAVEHQYLAAWTALETSVEDRSALLRAYVDARRAAVEDGRDGIRRYLIAPGGDPGHRRQAVSLLARHGIEVDRLTEAVTLDGVRDRRGTDVGSRRFPAGTYVVEAAQPMNRLIRTLLEPDVAVPGDFLREARERVERDRDARFYDITAWSLPLLFDLPGYSSADGRQLPTERLDRSSAEAAAPGPETADGARAGYAYVVDGRQAASVAVLHDLLERGHRAGMILDSTRIEDGAVPSGSIVVLVGENDGSIHADVAELAARHGVDVRALETGLAEPGGPSLGTDDLVRVRDPAVGIVGREPVHGYSFGWAWHALDRQYGITPTILRAGSLRSTPLRDLDTVVLPHLTSVAGLADALGDEGLDRLRRWVEDGGTLVAIGDAVEFARTELDLVELRSWYEVAASAGNGDDGEPYRYDVPGAFFRSEVEGSWWLAAGVPDRLPVLVASSRLYLPPPGPPDASERTVVRYAAGDSLHVSGHAWAESVERAGGGVAVYEERVGAGRVVAFAEDPNFRGFWRGADRLFLNAVVVGPSAP